MRLCRIADLIIPPKFIPQFPSKGAAVIRPMRIDVADPLGRLSWCSGAKVQRNLRLCLDELAKAEELVCTKGVVFRYSPGEVQSTHASVQRSHAIMPVVGGGEVASEPNDRGMEFPCQRQDFRAQAIHHFVRCLDDYVRYYTS